MGAFEVEHEVLRAALHRESGLLVRKIDTKPSTVATTQTIVWMRLTGTPSRAARSAPSALARMAMPTFV